MASSLNVVIGSNYLYKETASVGLHAFGDYFLARGSKVVWLTIPFSLIHFLKQTNFSAKQKRLQIAFGRSFQDRVGDGIIINRAPFTPVHPVGGLPLLDSYFVSRNYLAWAMPSLLRSLRNDGVDRIDILLFDSGGLNIYYPLRRLSKLVIHRISDFAAEFPGQARGRVVSEQEIIRNADLVLPVSESLCDAAVQIRGTADGVHLLPNGVHLELFKKKHPEPDDYKMIPHPRILFVGSLSSWLDWDLIIQSANLRPDYSFIIVGKGHLERKLPANVHLLGARFHEMIPAYMQHADVGIIPFKDLPRIQRVERPLKFYEYLASGLPIVSVPHGGLQKMKPYAFFGQTPEEFAEAIDAALQVPPAERERYKLAAQKYSWDAIFAQFTKILNTYGVNVR